MEPGTEDAAVARVLEAAVRCIARWGLSKTSIEDVAREAGVSRATLYRLVPGGRDVLFDRVAEAELARVSRVLARDLVAAPDLRELIVTGLQQGSRAIRDHEAVQYLLEHEPELILPHVAFDALDPLLASVTAFVAPFIAAHLPADAPEGLAEEVGEWVVRLVVGTALDPSPRDDLTRRHVAESLVDRHVLPGIALALADAAAPGDHERPQLVDLAEPATAPDIDLREERLQVI